MTTISTLGQALAQIDRIKNQQGLISQYTTQLTTGKKTQKFTGLGSDIMTSQRSRDTIQTLQTYQNNITHASRRIDLMLNSVEEFQSQAKKFLNMVQGLSQQDVHQQGETIYYDDPTTPDEEELAVGQTSALPDSELQNLMTFAKNSFTAFESILNAKDGDRYLFSGAETRSKPYTTSGLLDAAVNSLMSDWKDGTISSPQFISALGERDPSVNANALTDSIMGYSSELSAGNVGNVYVRADESFQLDYTALANDEGFRNILAATAFLKNESLPPMVDVYNPGNTPSPPFTPDVNGAPGVTVEDQKRNFFVMLNSMATTINQGITKLDEIVGNLSQAKVRLDDLKSSHTQEMNLMVSVVSGIEDIDQNEVAVKVSTLLNQIEISYSVTAKTQQLSLVNYINF